MTSTDLVEDVETTLGLQLEDNARFLQQVGIDITRCQFTSKTEVNTDEFTETGRVIVTSGLGITEGFHSGVSSDNLILKGSATLQGWCTIITIILLTR